MPFTRHDKVAHILQEAKKRADWDLVEARYKQCTEITGDPDFGYLPDEFPGLLAEAISRVSSSYHDAEETLAEHALAVFAEADGREAFNEKLFRYMYHDHRFRRLSAYADDVRNQRRLPTPYEAVVETCRRLRDANRLRQVFTNAGMSGVLGGSASYGRFYNIRGTSSSAPSDLDVVIINTDAVEFNTIGDRLGALPGIDMSSLESLMKRVAIFAHQYNDNQTVLSHKLIMWPTGTTDPLLRWAEGSPQYMLSLHFTALPVLDYILADCCTKLKRDSAGTKRTVRDYRDTEPTRSDHQRTFAGRNHGMDLDMKVAESGFLRPSRVYYIDESDSYAPGMFQNLLLPRLELRWDELDVKARFERFRWKMHERLRHERRMRPHAHLRLSFSHTRREFFAPHVTRSIDEKEPVD